MLRFQHFHMYTLRYLNVLHDFNSCSNKYDSVKDIASCLVDTKDNKRGFEKLSDKSHVSTLKFIVSALMLNPREYQNLQHSTHNSDIYNIPNNWYEFVDALDNGTLQQYPIFPILDPDYIIRQAKLQIKFAHQVAQFQPRDEPIYAYVTDYIKFLHFKHYEIQHSQVFKSIIHPTDIHKSRIFMMPNLKINILWHMHMMAPDQYEVDTKDICGTLLEYDALCVNDKDIEFEVQKTQYYIDRVELSVRGLYVK